VTVKARPRPAHFYHVWAGDAHHGSAWLEPFQEHFGAMRNAAFKGDVYAGIVGGLPQRAEVMKHLRGWWPESVIAVQADEGFEQVTIEVMHQWAKAAPPDTPVYYAHTKGAFRDTEMNRYWRREMDGHLIGGGLAVQGGHDWRECVDLLKTYDAVGLHWLTRREFPAHIGTSMFGGNFWWATAGYLAGLERVRGTPEFPPVDRWGAEAWLGQDVPKVHDFKPGWPVYG
jgi:hypothetical protein